MYKLIGQRDNHSTFEQYFDDLELLLEKANYLISQGFTTRITRS